MKEPLAYRLRPKNIDDIIGQDHLVGKNGIIRKCVEKGEMFSSIFFGPPGTGKTTLASVIANTLKLTCRRFNAVTGNKKDLDLIFQEAKLSGKILLNCDEVHRLKKYKQDLLLPHVENGNIILIGATTANPFHSINPAIRSRCHLFEFKPLSKEDVKKAIHYAISASEGLNNSVSIKDDALELLCDRVNGDVRSALNILEFAAVTCSDNIIVKDDIVAQCKVALQRTWGSEDGYYDLLSGFQKSIRGSDVNAALYYLALLANANDLESIVRRLLVIAYEDVGLANPACVSRTYPACQSALSVGFPEAIIPLGMQVIDLCLSPKSRTAVDATHKASDLVKEKAFETPTYLRLTPVNLNNDEKYSYERYDCFHKIQYLPDEIKDIEFIDTFQKNKYEQQLKLIYDDLKRNPRTNNLKKLYKKD